MPHRAVSDCAGDRGEHSDGLRDLYHPKRDGKREPKKHEHHSTDDSRPTLRAPDIAHHDASVAPLETRCLAEVT